MAPLFSSTTSLMALHSPLTIPFRLTAIDADVTARVVPRSTASTAISVERPTDTLTGYTDTSILADSVVQSYKLGRGVGQAVQKEGSASCAVRLLKRILYSALDHCKSSEAWSNIKPATRPTHIVERLDVYPNIAITVAESGTQPKHTLLIIDHDNLADNYWSVLPGHQQSGERLVAPPKPPGYNHNTTDQSNLGDRGSEMGGHDDSILDMMSQESWPSYITCALGVYVLLSMLALLWLWCCGWINSELQWVAGDTESEW